jgi:5'-nucleotidase
VSVRSVLVTNDDGIGSPGIRWLAQAAIDAGYEVIVAAPDYEASGSSAALSAVYRDRRLPITPASLDGLAVRAYSVQASPSYIVVLGAIGTFGERPDAVLSGINRGANAGYAVLHSGTVGAALTAANNRIPAMAVSLDALPAEDADPSNGGAQLSEHLLTLDNDSMYWSTASEVARGLLSTLDTLPEGVILNVNVPNRDQAELRGVRQADLAPFGQVQMAIAEAGEGYVRTTIERSSDRLRPGTDIALLAEGYATVTPVSAVRSLDMKLDV